MTKKNDKKTMYNIEINAITLSIEAKNEIIHTYRDFYGNYGFIQDEILIEIVNSCLILSLQKIEERLINAKIIIIDDSKLESSWPEGTIFINFKKILCTNLKFPSLKKYIGITEEPNVCLVMKNMNKNEGNIKLKIMGLLIFQKSIQNFASQFKLWNLTPDKYASFLGCMYNSLLITIDQGKVILSFLNKELLIIEKGIISYHPDISEFIYYLLERSNFYPIMEKYAEEGIHYLFDVYYSTLHNILFRISKDRHGSILIFCYDGKINNKKCFHPGAIRIKIPLLTFLQKKRFNVRNEKDIEGIIKMFEDVILSLNKTDGALIFNKDLDLVLAGAFLKVNLSSHNIGGARRKTAEAFTKSIEKMGISISQDGIISLFNSFPKTELDEMRERLLTE